MVKLFENWLLFEKVLGKNIVAPFLISVANDHFCSAFYMYTFIYSEL